jgi:hypothetical protein
MRSDVGWRVAALVVLAGLLAACGPSRKTSFFVTRVSIGDGGNLGHSNKVGSIGGDRVRSWNSAHLTAGCSVAALQTLGSGARLYCFAAK